MFIFMTKWLPRSSKLKKEEHKKTWVQECEETRGWPHDWSNHVHNVHLPLQSEGRKLNQYRQTYLMHVLENIVWVVKSAHGWCGRWSNHIHIPDLQARALKETNNSRTIYVDFKFMRSHLNWRTYQYHLMAVDHYNLWASSLSIRVQPLTLVTLDHLWAHSYNPTPYCSGLRLDKIYIWPITN